MILENIKRGYQYVTKMLHCHILKHRYPILVTFGISRFSSMTLESWLHLIILNIRLPMMILKTKRGYQYLAKMLYYNKLKVAYPVLKSFCLSRFRWMTSDSSFNMIILIIRLTMMTLENIKKGYNCLIKTLQYYILMIRYLILDSFSLPGLGGMTLKSSLNFIILTNRPPMMTLENIKRGYQ